VRGGGILERGGFWAAMSGVKEEVMGGNLLNGLLGGNNDGG